jgi:V/A-type H+/Na+-transporting ATPase subunit E
MSGIDNLTSKILSDAKAQSDAILAEAQGQEDRILEKSNAEAQKVYKEVTERAGRESINRKDRILSSAQLEARNLKLRAKQEVIERVFTSAIDALNKLSRDKYLSFVKEKILSMDVAGYETIITSGEDAYSLTEDFITDINSELVKQGKPGGITISAEKRNIGGGFILEKGGIEVNNTFEALVNAQRDDLEYELVKLLFG